MGSLSRPWKGPDVNQPNARNAPLKCLQGSPARPELIDGWNRMTRFPGPALSQWWDLLEPALTHSFAGQEGVRIRAFAQQFSLKEGDVVLALQACAFLITQSVALNLDADTFAGDLRTLGGGETGAAEVLRKRYDELHRPLRERIIEQTLLSHGNVLVDLDWRVDHIQASSHGSELDASVVMLSLAYRNLDRTERLTLQITPSAMRGLKEFVARFSGPSE